MAKRETKRRATGRPARSSTGRASASINTPEKQEREAKRVKAGTSSGGRKLSAKATKGKVGGSVEEAKRFGGKVDFGTPPGKAHPADRRVKTRVERPSQRAGQEGQRVVGVGATGDTPGKSGGAADTDILGIGTQGGSSVSTDGTLGKRRGKDMTTKGGAAPFGSGRPAKGKGERELVGKVGGNKRVRGSTTNAAEGSTQGGGGTGVGDFADEARDDMTINPLTGGPARRELDEDRS